MKVSQKQNFSLIELLIVIAILGVLTIMMMPKFGTLENDAKVAADANNTTGTARYLEMYRSANGTYPASLHTGMNDDGTNLVCKINGYDSEGYGVETAEPAMTGVLWKNMSLSTADLPADKPGAQFRESLRQAGLGKLAQGYNKLTEDVSATGIRYVSDDWYKGLIDSGYNNKDFDKKNPIVIRGKPLKGWVEYNGSLTFAYRIIPLFISRMTEWDKVRDINGQVVGRSKVGIQAPGRSPLSDKGSFSYYIAFFLANYDGSPAELFSVVSPAGQTVEEQAW